MSEGASDADEYKYNSFHCERRLDYGLVSSNEDVLSIWERLIEKNEESYEVPAK